jgi:hypothetical protein
MLNLIRRPWSSPEQSPRDMPESLESNHSLSENRVSCKPDAADLDNLFVQTCAVMMQFMKFASSMDAAALSF